MKKEDMVGAILTIYSLEQHRARVHPETSEYVM